MGKCHMISGSRQQMREGLRLMMEKNPQIKPLWCGDGMIGVLCAKTTSEVPWSRFLTDCKSEYDSNSPDGIS